MFKSISIFLSVKKVWKSGKFQNSRISSLSSLAHKCIEYKSIFKLGTKNADCLYSL